MIEACPNLNDPVVARAFNELKEATSEKTAYNIWSLNNGYGIDKAPNGAESVLFNSLLIECNGDRRAAIRAKAALYGNNFRKWFGDWTHAQVSGITKVVDNDGKIRLRLESHTKEHPREIVLDPQGNNKYYVHTRTWDGEHVPADMTQEEKLKLYEAFYNELPDDAEVLLPLSSDDYLATRGTVANLMRLSRDDRFKKGELSGTVKYSDKDGSVKEYSGTSFIKKPSVSKVVDENGEPLIVYHGGAREINTFRLPDDNSGPIDFHTFYNLEWADRQGFNISENLRDQYNKTGYIENAKKATGIYFAENKVAARSYFGRQNEEDDQLYSVFLNIKNPHITNKSGVQMVSDASTVKDLQTAKNDGKDGVIIENVRDYGPNDWERFDALTDHFADEPFTDYVTFDPNQIKSAVGNREIEQPGTGFSLTDDNINHIYLPLKYITKKTRERFETLGQFLDYRARYYFGSLIIIPSEIYNSDGTNLEKLYDEIDFFVQNLLLQQVLNAIDHLNSLKIGHPIPAESFLQNAIRALLRKLFTGDYRKDSESFTQRDFAIYQLLFPNLFNKPRKLSEVNKIIGLYLKDLYRNKSMYLSIIENYNKREVFSKKAALDKLIRLNKELTNSATIKKNIINNLYRDVFNYISHSTYKYEKNEEEENYSFMNYLLSMLLLENAKEGVVNGKLTYSVKKILQQIKDTDPRFSYICDRILSTVDGDISLYFHKKEDTSGASHYSMLHDGRKYHMIAVNENNLNDVYKDFHYIIMHEVVHSVTAEYIKDHLELLLKLRSYIEQLKLQNGELAQNLAQLVIAWEQNSAYGFRNEVEFVAEFFTNAEFREILKLVKPLDQSKFKSLFEEFVDFILGLFGINRNNSAYDQILPVMQHILENGIDSDEYNDLLPHVIFDDLQILTLQDIQSNDIIIGGTQSYEDTAAEFLSSSPAIQTAFNVQRENYIRSHNPQTEDERNQLAREFDLDQMKLNTERVTEAIAKEYGLSILPTVVVSGPFRQAFPTYTANDEKGKYVAMLLNSMNKRLSDPNFASTEARFLLDTVIGTNDISTIIMQMARVYIEDFYEADAIQEVMAMIDPTGKMHKDDLIDTLTDMVTKATIDPKSTEVSTVTKINNTILNFVRKRFNQNTISEQAKRMLIGVIAENMSCYEDLQRVNTEDLLHDVKWYEITGKESQVTPKNIVDAIKKGVKIQIKSQLSVTNVDSEKLLILNLMLSKLEAIDFDNNQDDVLGVVSDFIVDGMLDINKANATLHSMLAIDPANIDSKQLYSIRTDVIGYYRSIINNYIIPFTRNTTNQTLLPGGALYSTIRSILDKCTHTQQLYDYVLRVYVEKLIDNFVDSNVNIGDKERFKVNCKLWLHNKVNNGDLGFFENWIKSAVSSHSPIVRMVDDFVREYETDVRKQALKKAKQLQNTYRKCEPSLAKLSPFNYQRNFCELDDDGQTTGNFISEVNVGQFDKEKKQFIDWWIENCGVTRNEDGVLEFPDDETWKEFNDAYDDFLDGRQHRRYTAGYYKLERLFLSRDTIEYRRNIRKRILLLYDKCYDKDIDGPNIWSLNREDYLSLLDLLKLQQNLANPYIITYDTDGKISKIEEKVDDAARMAREISEFNKVISGNIKFTPNYDKYNSAKKAIELKFGKNSNEYKAFVYNFSTRAVKQKYYERLELIFGPKSSLIFPALDRINNKIKAIINATISKRGKYVLDLSKMSDAAYAELKKLEEEKINLLRTLKTKSGKKLTQEEWDEINGMHHYEYIVNPATGIPVIKELEQEYDQKGKHQEFLNKFFVISDDSAHPLSIFLYDRIEPEYIDEELPIGMFSDVDESSYYIDPLYDPEDKEFMNVDKKRYHNDKFDELKKDSNAYKFYTEMLKMMDEAWSMLPDINRHYKYMLPQRRGSISLLVARDIVNTFTGKQGRQKISFKQVSKNIIKLVIAGMLGGLALGGLAALSPWITTSAALITGAGYGTITGFIAGLLTRDKNISDQLLSITENDVQFNESFAVRPDGTEVETIPIRFVRRLDDPTSVSTDLINSVSTFYEMALNYKQKEKLAPIVENILFELSGGFNGNSITDLADRVRSYKSAMIYGRKKTGLARRSSNKMTQSEQKISKLVSFILNTTHAKMLPWNGTSIYKNMIDSTLSLISLLTSMKQLTPQDLGYGIIDMGKEIFNGTAFTNIGSPNTSSFTGAAMQYNGVHMNIGGTFGDTLKYWVRRCFERFMSMGPFTLIDYTFKGLFTNMVYNTYRLVLNPSTGKMEFVNKQEAQFAYAGENGGRKEGLKRWKKATTKLRDAYVVTEDGLQLKDEYKELVSKKLETRVSGLIREQSAVVNGMLDEQDINKVSQNFIGSMILLMRGWMVSQLIDYNKDGQDFAVFATNTEDINTKLFGSNNLGSLQSKFIGSLDAFVSQQAPADQEGQYNFATGFIERGWWVGWNKLVKNALSIRRLTPHNKYQLRYLAMILLTTISLGLATHPLYKWRESSDELYKETDPYNVERVASNFLYTGTVAAYSERFGQIGPLGFGNSLLELVNSPTVASSYIKDLNSIIDVSEDIFKLTDELWHGYGIDQTEPMQIVKRGSFKGRTKLTKDLLKASTEMPVINELGIANIYKTISPDAQKEKLKFYKKTIPFTGIQPWLKLPETGLLKTTTSKAAKPVKKYR